MEMWNDFLDSFLQMIDVDCESIGLRHVDEIILKRPVIIGVEQFCASKVTTTTEIEPKIDCLLNWIWNDDYLQNAKLCSGYLRMERMDAS